MVFLYVGFYFGSEENVYLLCKTLCENGVADTTGSDLFVVFISNEKKQARILLYLLCFGLVCICTVSIQSYNVD